MTIELLEDRDSHALIRDDDHGVRLVPWSDRNKLLYRHGLADVVDTGTESLVLPATDTGPRIVVTPLEDATEFALTVGGDEDGVDAHVPSHEKSAFLDVLLSAYEQGDADGPARGPLTDYVSELLDLSVNPNVVDALAEVPPFDSRVEVTQDGWLIYDHLLLTYDNEFYHPNTTAKTRSGDVVGEDASWNAYELRYEPRVEDDDDDGQTELGAFADALGDSDDHVDFVARALWAVQVVPREDPNNE